MGTTLFGHSIFPIGRSGYRVSRCLTRAEASVLIEKIRKRWPAASCELEQVFVESEERRFYGKEFEQMIVKTYPKDEFRLTIWNIGEEDAK